MASQSYMSPLLQLLLAAMTYVDLRIYPGACHALQRQSPLTGPTFFPPNNGDDTSWANSVLHEQCVDQRGDETAVGLAAVSPPNGLENGNSDNQLYRRGEAQRCLLPSRASLLHQQQLLGPEAEGFPCASKYSIVAAGPPASAVIHKQRQRLQQQQQPPVSHSHLELPNEHFWNNQTEKQRSRLSQKAHKETEAASGIAFNWRDVSHPHHTAIDSSQEARHFRVAAVSAGKPVVAAEGRPGEHGSDGSAAPAALTGKANKHAEMSFTEAVGRALASEAAAFIGGAWDMSTWGLGGIHSTPGPAPLPVIRSDGTTTAHAATENEIRPGAGAESAAPLAVAAPTIASGSINPKASEAPADALVAARDPAKTSVSGHRGTLEGASAVVAPSSLVSGGPAAAAVAHNTTPAQGLQHRKAAKEANGNNGTTADSSWWGKKTWTEAIRSFFQKLDQRIEDAHGVLAHSDLYEFTL